MISSLKYTYVHAKLLRNVPDGYNDIAYSLLLFIHVSPEASFVLDRRTSRPQSPPKQSSKLQLRGKPFWLKSLRSKERASQSP